MSFVEDKRLSSWVVIFGGLLLILTVVEGGSTGRRSDRNEVGVRGGAFKDRRRCISYDDNLRLSEDPGREELSYLDEAEGPMMTEMICERNSQFCYALWRYSSNGTREWIKQGCWEAPSSNTPTCLNEQCVAILPKPKAPKGSKAPQSQGDSDKQDTTTPVAGGEVEPPQQDQRSAQNKKQPHFYCCCHSDNCNLDVEEVYVEPEEDEEEDSEEVDLLGAKSLVGSGSNKNLAWALVLMCGCLICTALIIAGGYRYWRRISGRQRKDGGIGGGLDGEAGEDGDGDVIGLAGEGKLLLLGGGEGESLLGEDSGIADGIQLVVLLARGKFASVYEGRIASLSDAPFALKCFAREQKEFFENERFVFNYLGKHCNHENIIKYYGWQEFTVGPTTHLILVLDKICPGSLRDFLQSITMGAESRIPSNPPGEGQPQQENVEKEETIFKIQDVLRICSGISAGLSYLHGENRDEIVIAHRDLTSKNILLDSSTLTPKITDFGLSLVTRGSKYYWAGRERQAEFCSLAEAGTLRYMAPELLEGAVNLKDCENALKQADVYALALILWEVANCSQDVRLTQVARSQSEQQQQGDTATITAPPPDPSTPQYLPVNHSLPYEDEIGKDNLSMDALSRHVVQYRQRPHFRRWRDSPYTRQLRDTLIESWDAEPDARLTALCIVERLHDIRSIRLKNSDLSKGATHQSAGQALQSPLESPTSGLFGPDGNGLIDSPWTGRNPCLQRNLLANNTTTSSSGGTHSSEGLSTSGSMLSDATNGGGLPTHPLLLNHFDLAKNQANLNFYHNYVGGSSGGTSYTGSTTGTAPSQGTEVSNVSSVTDDRGGQQGTTRCPSASISNTHHHLLPSHHNPLPPSIPFLQNLHN